MFPLLGYAISVWTSKPPMGSAFAHDMKPLAFLSCPRGLLFQVEP